MKNTYWKPAENVTESFYLQEEPEMIHVIKTGFKDRYMVVEEDAYEQVLGNVTFGTKAEIEDRYKITLTL